MTDPAILTPTAADTRIPGSGNKNYTRLLDIAERTILLVLAVDFLWRFLPSLTALSLAHLYPLLLMVSETLGVVLILLRSPGSVNNTLRAWTVALLGTAAPLLVMPGGGALLPLGVGALLMFIGLFFSIAAKASLRRSFGIVAANRGVKRGGPYRLVRHPMYFGYLLTHIGFLSLNFMLFNVLVYALSWAAQIRRILEEEAILSRDPAYRAYRAETRWRLLPGIW